MTFKFYVGVAMLATGLVGANLAFAQSGNGRLAENSYTKEEISAAVEAQLSLRNTIKGEDLHTRLSKAMLLSYVTGVDDLGAMTGDVVRRYCRPEGSTNGQMADVVSKYLTLNPETRHLGGAYLVRQALYEAWPCAQPRTPEKPELPRSNM